MPTKSDPTWTSRRYENVDGASSMAGSHERRIALAVDNDIPTDGSSQPTERVSLAPRVGHEGDLLAQVPMPSTIHGALRGALADVFIRRFVNPEDLGRWLHRANDMLADRPPAEVLIQGDGRAVLRAVLLLPDAGSQSRIHPVARSAPSCA